MTRNTYINNVVEELVSDIPFSLLKAGSTSIRERYRDKEIEVKGFELTKDTEALAYTVYRMPQTAMVIEEVLERLLEAEGVDDETEVTEEDDTYDNTGLPAVETVLDFGSGTGASLFSLTEIHGLRRITLLEEQDSMVNVSRRLLRRLEPDTEVEIRKGDILKSLDEKFDMVMASYVINEMDEGELDRLSVVLDRVIGRYLILIVPGTPHFFRKLEYLKVRMVDRGFRILAPCMGTHGCHLPPDDWCHFSKRIERSSMLRRLKDAEMSYEDEKYSYVILRRPEPGNSTESTGPRSSRIIRHPLKAKGILDLVLCEEKEIRRIRVTKGRNREIYKESRKLSWGDIFPG